MACITEWHFLQLFLLFNNLFLSSVAQGNAGKWAKSVVWVKRHRNAAKPWFPPWQERLLGWWIPKKWLCGGWHRLQQESHAETGTRQQVRISVSHSCTQTLCGFPVCGVGSMSAGHPWNTWAAEPSRKKVREGVTDLGQQHWGGSQASDCKVFASFTEVTNLRYKILKTLARYFFLFCLLLPVLDN